MRRWLVTGASRGLGAEIAEAALKAGDTVAVSARSGDALAARFGNRPNAIPVPFDVTDETGVLAAVDTIDARMGGIDVLVNNAGYGLLGAIEEVSAEEFDRQYRTNVFGLLNVTRAVLPIMRRQRSGRIINMSSLGGYAAMPAWGAYHSSKFAVEGISEALRQEVAPLGISVTLLEPVHFNTDFMASDTLIQSERIIEDYAATSGQSRRQAEQVAAMAADPNAVQTGGDPRDLAVAVLRIVKAANPPFRLPIGQRAIDRMRAKHAEVDAEVDTWRSLCLLENLGVDEAAR